MAWQFKREEAEFEELAEGRYRVMIVDAEMAVSKSGNDMLVIKLLVSGTKKNLWNYITKVCSKLYIQHTGCVKTVS